MIITNVQNCIIAKPDYMQRIIGEINYLYQPSIDEDENTIYFNYVGSDIVKDISKNDNISSDEDLFIRSLISALDNIALHYIIKEYREGDSIETLKMLAKTAVSKFLFGGLPLKRCDDHKLSDLYKCSILTYNEKVSSFMTLYDAEYINMINSADKKYVDKFDGKVVCFIDFKRRKIISMSGSIPIISKGHVLDSYVSPRH